MERKNSALYNDQHPGDSTQNEMENYKSLEYMRRLNHKNQMTNYILSILRFSLCTAI